VTPYKDGVEAAWRQGKYEGVKDTPECPYPDGSPEFDEWWLAFGDATQDMIDASLTP